MKDKKIILGLVSETNEYFVNQSKLCLSSFRRNAGELKDVPILFVTNNNELEPEDKKFFIDNFSPITFIVKERINIINTASKFNIFNSIAKEDYDIMLFLDCDTVVVGALDGMLQPIINGDCQFLCRRGGDSDRAAFVDIDNTLNYLGGDKSECLVDGERPRFNTGVFALESKVADKLNKTGLEVLYKILNKYHVRNPHYGEQCAIALACALENIQVKYLDEIYNSWGNLENIKILHCFKSRYKFNRKNMFENFDKWKYNYGSIIGERLLIQEVEKFIKEKNILHA